MIGIVRPLTRRRRVALMLATALAVSSAVPLLSADLRPDYQPVAYAIKGAKVVAVSGDPIEIGTVIVRDGVIAAVGQADRIEIPYDAEVIDGKGLVVYPGFIDLYTTSGQDANATTLQNIMLGLQHGTVLKNYPLLADSAARLAVDAIKNQKPEEGHINGEFDNGFAKIPTAFIDVEMPDTASPTLVCASAAV